MSYCLYVRKSRADAEAEARGEGETLARHINTLLALAKQRNMSITQVYREIVSGETIAARPVMQRLLSDVESGLWEGVLVMEIERLARGDTIDQGIVAQTFKFSDTKIITPIKDYDPKDEFDEEYFEFGLFMSRREYKTINRRLQRGRLTSVKEGKYVTSQAPYGYRRVRLENEKGFTLEPIPEEADVVRLIYHLYTQGEEQEDGSVRRIGVHLIACHIDRMQFRPRKGDHWSAASIREILSNPIYIGKIRWNFRPAVKKVVDGRLVTERPKTPLEKQWIANGMHPAIIDEDTFKLAQEIKKNNLRPLVADRSLKNPLASIVVCGKCGKRMVRRPHTAKYPSTLMCRNPFCDNISCMLSTVEEHVISGLHTWLSEYRLHWAQNKAEKQPNGHVAFQVRKNALQRLKEEHQMLLKQLDHTHDFLEQGIYTPEQFVDRSRKLSERIRCNEESISSLYRELEKEKQSIERREFTVPKIERVLEVYSTLSSIEAKNALLKEILEKVVYLKEKGGRWSGCEEEFELTFYPRVPKA